MEPPTAASLAIERYRHYLKLIGRMHVGEPLFGKVDLSGVIQETLLEAHQAGKQLLASPEASRMAWMRRAFTCNLNDAFRKLGAESRDIDREVSLDAAVESASARIEEWLAAEHSSPSQRASANEQMLKLAAALDELPEDQRMAVELRHLQGLALSEVARCMGRTRDAVAGLIFRGLRGLRKKLEN